MLAYIASTLVVLAWLSYVIHITLTDNVEAANGTVDPGRTSQLIRVCHSTHADVHLSLLLMLTAVSTPVSHSSNEADTAKA